MNKNEFEENSGYLSEDKMESTLQNIPVAASAVMAESSNLESDVMPLKSYPNAPFSYSAADNENVSMGSGAFQYTVTDFTLPGKNGLDLVMTRQYDSNQAATKNLKPIQITGGPRSYYYVIFINCLVENMATGKTEDHYNVPQWAEYDFINPNERTAARVQAWNNDYFPQRIFVEDGLRFTETLRFYEDSFTPYPVRRTETGENNHFVDAYGLGHGWSFAFPSIEQITEVKSNGRDVEDKPYLHLADGRTFKLRDNPTSAFGSNLVDYSIGDVRIQKISGNISHADSSAAYEYIVYYKNGQKDYLEAKSPILQG